MVEEINGISEPDDITGPTDAAEMFDLPLDASEDDIEDKFRDLSTTAHPDVGGTTELFQAVKKARDELVAATGVSAGTEATVSGEGDDVTATGSFGTINLGAEVPDDEIDPKRKRIRDTVETILIDNVGEADLRDRFGPNATIKNVKNVLGDLIIMGWIDLADVEQIADVGDPRFSRGARGSDPRFQHSSRRGGDPRFQRNPRTDDDDIA